MDAKTAPNDSNAVAVEVKTKFGHVTTTSCAAWRFYVRWLKPLGPSRRLVVDLGRRLRNHRSEPFGRA